MRSFQEIAEQDREAFNAFVSSSPSGHVFQSYEWGDLRKGDGWTPFRFTVTENGSITATVTVLEKSLGGFNVFYAPRGPVVDFGDEETFAFLMEQLTSFFARKKATFFQIDPDQRMSSEPVKSLLERHGFVRKGELFYILQPDHVFRLDISRGLDAIHADFSHSVKRNIRIAEKAGLRIELRDDIDALKILYGFLKKTSRRRHFLIRSFDYQKRLLRYFIERGYGKIFLARFNGEPVAARLALRFGAKCWDMYASSSGKYQELKANHLIVWEMMKWAKSQGCTIFDFRGAGAWNDPAHPDRGIYDFKVKFGPELVKFMGEYYLVFDRERFAKYEALHGLMQGALRLPERIKGVFASRSTAESLTRITFDKYGEKEELEEYSRRALQDGLGYEERFVSSHLKPPMKALVEGAGAGREALHLARLGFDVTGVDFQPMMVEAAKANADKAGLKIDFRRMDALALEFAGNSFGAVLMFGSLLAHIPSREHRLRALREAHRVLEKGGRLLIAVPSKECAFKYRAYYSVMDNLRRAANIAGITTMEPGDRIAKKVSGDVVSKGGCFFHMFSPAEMKADLAAAGFDVVEAVSRRQILEGRVFEPDAGKDYFMYFCARKHDAKD